MNKLILSVLICLVTEQIIGQEESTELDSAPNTCAAESFVSEDAIQRLSVLADSEMTEEHIQLLVESLPPLQLENSPVCAYTLTTISSIENGLRESGETIMVERFTPVGDADGNWSLLKVDDRPPTNRDLDMYELDANVKIRSLRIPPWRFDKDILLQKLKVVNNPEFGPGVFFEGSSLYSPNLFESEEDDFIVSFAIDSWRRQLVEFSLKLESPIRPSAFSVVNRYELREVWEFDAVVKRAIRQRRTIVLDGSSGPTEFQSKITTTVAEFYCPTTTNLTLNAEAEPCPEDMVDP